jgi:hypothetical protein
MAQRLAWMEMDLQVPSAGLCQAAAASGEARPRTVTDGTPPSCTVFDGSLRHAVLMQVLPFGGGRQLSISIAEPSAIMRGAGLHRLTCRVALDARNTIVGGVPVALSGWAWLSTVGMDWLGGWSTEGPVVTRQGQPFDATLVLPLTDEQLAVIEQRRAGSDIRIQFDGNIVLGFDPAVAGGAEDDRPRRTQPTTG